MPGFNEKICLDLDIFKNPHTFVIVLIAALLARASPTDAENRLLERVRASIQLTNARRNIQQKYLNDLRISEEVSSAELSVVEVPLLPSEVTGPSAILNFSQRLVPNGYRPGEAPMELKGWVPTPAPVNTSPTLMEDEVVEVPHEFVAGDVVIVHGLGKAPQYNGLEGTVNAGVTDGRVSVNVTYNGSKKTLLLKPDNLTFQEHPEEPEPKPASNSSPTSGLEAMLMNDPEIADALKKPKFKKAFEDCKSNPLNFMQ